MKDKAYTTVDDLLEDDSFRLWASGASEGNSRNWGKWMAQHPEREQLVDEAVLILKGPSFKFEERPVDPVLVENEWEKLRARTTRKGLQSMAKPRKVITHLPRRALFSRLRVAASIVLIVAASFLLREWIANPMIEHQTPYGQRISLVLPDSTTVELNANSKLTYRKQNPRKVWLDGEAFFHVRKKPETGANFQVLTNDLTVEVLGTAFNVVEKDDKTEVVLEEGSVKLDLKRDFERELYLEPGELVSFKANSTAPVKKQKVKSISVTSWKEGVLQFEDVPLSSVMQRIEEIYGWRSEYSNEDLRNRKVSMPLPADDLASAMTLLSRAIGIDIKKVDEERLLLLD